MSQRAKKRYVKPDSVKWLENKALEDLKKKYPSFPYPPKPTYRDNTSNGLTKCVIDCIELLGYQAERINSTGIIIQKGTSSLKSVFGGSNSSNNTSWIKGSSKVGTADISAVIKGMAVKIEIKCKATGDNYQSETQIKYQKEIERAGGVYVVVRDFDSFIKWLKVFLRNGK